MGWCIDCHRQKEVDMVNMIMITILKYKNFKETNIHEGVENFTVDMIGGLEWSK